MGDLADDCEDMALEEMAMEEEEQKLHKIQEEKKMFPEDPTEITDLTIREQNEMQIGNVKYQIEMLNQLYSEVLKPDVHYGVIPGTDKPTLYKSGAEEILKLFQYIPDFEVSRIPMTGEHIMYEVKCKLYKNDVFRGSGVGACSTMEKKYRWRTANRVCPSCKKDSIIKGKEEYGGGWLCWKKKGGCGAQFSDTDYAITSQPVGSIENADIADVYNTVLKIAKKRAFVDAVLTIAGVSSIFIQDMEDGNIEVNQVVEVPGNKPGAPTHTMAPETQTLELAEKKLRTSPTMTDLKENVVWLKKWMWTATEQEKLNIIYNEVAEALKGKN